MFAHKIQKRQPMLHITNKRKIFKYCLDLYVIRDKNCIGFCCSHAENLLTKIKIAKKAGFTGIELWHKDVKNYIENVAPIEKLKEEIEKLELCVPSYKVMQNWGDYEPLKFAGAIGAESCVIKLFNEKYNGEKPKFNYMQEKYKILLEDAEKHQVKPSLEFMSLAKYYNNINETIDIIDGINHPLKSYVLDTWHLWRNDDRNFTNCPFERMNPADISVIHYTDTCRKTTREKQTDGHRRLPYEGILNLENFSKQLHKIGYCGWVSLNVYDQSLWNFDNLHIASKGYYLMNRSSQAHMYNNLQDHIIWKNKQKIRCDGLWCKNYWTHLDPRINISNRKEKLLEIIKNELENKVVLDFKCGFSPLAEYVTYGFDAFDDCINYLNSNYIDKFWYCQSDFEFSSWFDKKIDVLLHIGLGDSVSEIESHLAIRKKCNPEVVIIEAAANDEDRVDESKIGNQKNWETLKKGLNGKTYIINTNMKERSKRILFIGKNHDN